MKGRAAGRAREAAHHGGSSTSGEGRARGKGSLLVRRARRGAV